MRFLRLVPTKSERTRQKRKTIYTGLLRPFGRTAVLVIGVVHRPLVTSPILLGTPLPGQSCRPRGTPGLWRRGAQSIPKYDVPVSALENFCSVSHSQIASWQTSDIVKKRVSAVTSKVERDLIPFHYCYCPIIEKILQSNGIESTALESNARFIYSIIDTRSWYKNLFGFE